MKKYLIYPLIAFIAVSCAKNATEERVEVGEALGTTYQIKYFSEKDIQLDTALDSIFESINNSMSTYRPGSYISKINSGDSTVKVDADFRKVFEYSSKIYEESGGYFDPTVGILVNAYGFGPGKQLAEPDEKTMDSLRKFVGFNKLDISSDNTIVKNDPHIYLDFNAIAKGYTIDVIAEYLDSKNVGNYLIELGGELVGKGRNLAKDSEWLVGIDDPRQKEDERTYQAVLALKDRALATSGNYRKFRIDSVTGKKFVHTINPLTGKAQKSNILSASVLADNCALADGYATAFMALGLEKSKEMLKKLDGVDVYLIYAEEGKSEESVFASPGFKTMLRE